MGERQIWAVGKAYEPYIGRWSRVVAREFLAWLNVAPGAVWLDVGCGTGALTATVLKVAAPAQVVGIDTSAGFVDYARGQISDPRATFEVGDAQSLPFPDARFGAIVSGLVLNFVPRPSRAVAEIKRVARQGALVGVYVWDYAGRMDLLRYFWDAALELDPAAIERDEGALFPLCAPEPLGELFTEAGFREVEVRAIDVATHFRDLDDYWSPFLGGQGPAAAYAMSLTEERRTELRELLRSRLPVSADGSIRLIARAWAVRGTRL